MDTNDLAGRVQNKSHKDATVVRRTIQEQSENFSKNRENIRKY